MSSYFFRQRQSEPADAPDPEPDLAALKREVQRLREMLDLNSDWIWEVDAAGRYTYVSLHCLPLLGYAPEEMLGRTPFDFMPADEAARVGAAFAAIVAEKRSFSHLLNRNIRSDGRIVVLETSGVPLLNPDGSLRGYRGIDRDITEREAATERLRHAARHDSLTELPNRLYLREHLEARLGGTGCCALAIDLDRFKPINDRLGHEAGDLVLREIGRRLVGLAAARRVFAARPGGDEFVVVADAPTPDAAGRLAVDLRAAIAGPIALAGETVAVGASVGIAHARDGDTVDTLLAAADRALYRAKSERDAT
ncbi:diguanylate cyclase domain-containing protein [Methylobacterium radiodurans]|uniref:Desulfoferrodoxin n=1 Tax=Methylobacterium radiodurans TaxID=2202828 RepID=A0A2U8VMV3_9HYPH|nr:diguanylate cyclase [Methylobacterium radiodurans]AWN34943.1 desulfoferrodoxin [Methylobacterium radiodurans]